MTIWGGDGRTKRSSFATNSNDQKKQNLRNVSEYVILNLPL